MTGWHVRRCCLPWWREGGLRFTHASESTCILQVIIYYGCFAISYIWKWFANKTCENVCILLCRPVSIIYCNRSDKYSCTSCSFFTIKACQMFAEWKLLMWGSIISILTWHSCNLLNIKISKIALCVLSPAWSRVKPINIVCHSSVWPYTLTAPQYCRPQQWSPAKKV